MLWLYVSLISDIALQYNYLSLLSATTLELYENNQPVSSSIVGNFDNLIFLDAF